MLVVCIKLQVPLVGVLWLIYKELLHECCRYLKETVFNGDICKHTNPLLVHEVVN